MEYFIAFLVGYMFGQFAGIVGTAFCKAAKIGDEMYGIDEERM